MEEHFNLYKTKLRNPLDIIPTGIRSFLCEEWNNYLYFPLFK